MKILNIKTILLLTFTLCSSSCGNPDSKTTTSAESVDFEVCVGDRCIWLKASCKDDTTYHGPIGNETDRTTGLGVEHIIHVSVDGLNPASITTLGIANLPALYFIRNNGSYTDNARTDSQYANTLPNHTSQFTSRPILGTNGHNWTWLDNGSEYCANLHYNNGAYVSSVFDVIHDYGLSTALYASKTKFDIYINSWDINNGAIDQILPDSGQNKIDKYVVNTNISNLTDLFLVDLAIEKYNYAFIHLKDPDSAGHDFTWSLETNSEYLQAVKRADQQIQKILNFMDSHTDFKNSTVLIVTADHGGTIGADEHEYVIEKGVIESGVVPYYVYGQSVPSGDLYAWNPATTFDPGPDHPLNDADLQPVRNGDTANLILELLGLPNVPDSSINNLNFP